MTQSVPRHRRPRRTGWIAAVVGGTLIMTAGTTAALLSLSGDGCTEPPVTLNVATSPDQFPVMDHLAETWNSGAPTVGARCTRVAVQAVPSSVAAATLAPGWDEQQDGPRPDVWVPDSSIWLLLAAARPDAAAMLPAETPPSLASSPVVLAMQRPMAEALGWPDRGLGWMDLLGAFTQGQTWVHFGHPEWGPLQLGIADPTRSTAGLAGVLTALDLDNDNTLDDQELLSGITFAQLTTTHADDTNELLRVYAGDAEAGDLPAAFPILERDLAAHTADGDAVPLVPVYLREGAVFADYPYTVLGAPWVGEDRQLLAAQFLSYLRGTAGRQAYAAAGFRAPEHSAADTPLLSPERGFKPQVVAPPRVPSVTGLTDLLGMWPVLVRSNNFLVVLDTSGSMDNEVPGTDLTRLQLLQRAAIEGIGLLNNQSIVGLWEFSTALTPTTPYRELVPVGAAGESVEGVNRRQAMVTAIQRLSADGGTGLYDTVHDAYLQMQRAWQAGAQNLLVVITDGRDEDHDGRSLTQLLVELEQAVRPERPLPIIALAVGPEADTAALERITDVTGGRTVVARDDVSIIPQIVLAFAGRLPQQ